MHFKIETSIEWHKMSKNNPKFKMFDLHLLHAVLASPVYPGRQTHFAE